MEYSVTRLGKNRTNPISRRRCRVVTFKSTALTTFHDGIKIKLHSFVKHWDMLKVFKFTFPFFNPDKVGLFEGSFFWWWEWDGFHLSWRINPLLIQLYIIIKR